MPDWFYHPVARPLLACLPDETARRVTIELLAAQARLPGGPTLFRTLATAQPPRQLRREFAGLELASPVGIGAGIDPEGRASVLTQELGVGFLELGPAGNTSKPAASSTNPRLLRSKYGLASSTNRHAATAGEIAARLTAMKVPIGIQLRAEGVVEAIKAVEKRVTYITLSPQVGESRQMLRWVRAATQKPLMIRMMSTWPRAKMKDVARNALIAGIDGGVVVAGSEFAGLDDGEIVWNAALPAAMSCLEEVADYLPCSLSGGVLTPAEAEKALSAGASALFLTDGLIFAGPGLPKRINRHLVASRQVGRSVPKEKRIAEVPDVERVVASTACPVPPSHLVASIGTPAPSTVGGVSSDLPAISVPRLRIDTRGIGVGLNLVAGILMVAAGILYLLLAGTVTLLPHETRYLGMSVATLCQVDDCRLVAFIDHGRACYGGILIAVGVMMAWLANGPMRRSEVWAWWTFAAGGAVMCGSFFSFLIYGYLDAWHAGFIVIWSAAWCMGLLLTKPSFGEGEGPIAAFKTPGAEAWMWSPAGRGRLLLFTFALALMVAGVSILVVADTDVFVSQDLAFIGMKSDQMAEVSDKLLPLMAHDRSGFGGGLLALGLLCCATTWMGVRTDARGAWYALGIAGFCLMVPALAAHLAVGYTSVVHLSPVYNGAVLLTVALVTLRKTMTSGQYSNRQMPDV